MTPHSKRYYIMAVPAFVVTMTVAMSAPAAAQKSDGAADRKAIEASAQAFTEAFNKGDAAAIATLWLEDGEYIDEQGQQFHGREAIQKEYDSFFAASPAAKIEIHIDSVNVTGDTAIEHGQTGFGGTTTGYYTAVHVRRNGKWLIASVRDTAAEVAPSENHVADLDFLAGDWTASRDEVKLTINCRWISGERFLERSWNASRSGNVVSSGTQIIGWDAARDQLTSWSFTSDGGHAVGLWTPQENGWRIESSGVLSDGTPTSSVEHFSSTDTNRLSWRSSDRMIGGVQIPDIAQVALERKK